MPHYMLPKSCHLENRSTLGQRGKLGPVPPITLLSPKSECPDMPVLQSHG